MIFLMRRFAFLPSRCLHTPGFKVAGVNAKLRQGKDRLDLALITSTKPCVVSGVFTQNTMRAPPVILSERLILESRQGEQKGGQPGKGIQAVVINSGCANACTGEEGMANSRRMVEAVQLETGLGSLVMSTGVIGLNLPMPAISRGITAAATNLREGEEAWSNVAEAIMTTDTYPKLVTTQCSVGGKKVTFTGIAKGSGMIHPNMATMLSVVATDAAIDAATLDATLRHVADRTFNCVTVDGDTSTNDSCIVMANGEAGNKLIVEEHGQAFDEFRQGLHVVMVELARHIALDGEGSTKLLTVEVAGAPSFAQGKQVARAIAVSPLVKTALFGNDANWGRVVCAAGNAKVPFDPVNVSLVISSPSSAHPPLTLFERGKPALIDESVSTNIIEQKEVHFLLDLGMAERGVQAESVVVWTCDLSHDYVDINGSYRT